MDFDPLSDNEEDATFMPERKKRDKEEKRRKSKNSHKSDKKEKASFNDGSTPTTMKTKNVHGVVGPAEYIQESSPTHDEPLPLSNQLATSPSNQAATQKTANQLFSQQQVTPQKLQPQPSQQSALPQSQPATPQPKLQWTPQQQQFAQQQQHSNSTPNFQQIQFQATPNIGPAQFSTSFNTSSTKIERPHSSAALLQERTPHSLAAFKHPSAQQQKMTLLAQAMSSSQTSLQSTPPVQQNSTMQTLPNNQQLAAIVAAANMTHHRNSSYSRAMSLPVASTTNNQDGGSDQDHFRFNANFDKGTIELAGSPIIESPSTPFQRSDPFTTPPLTPNNKYSSQELWNNAPPVQYNPHSHHHHSDKTKISPNLTATVNNQQQQHQQKQPDGDWAHFSPQTEDTALPPRPSSSEAGHVKSNHIDIPRRRSQTESMASSSMASSIPESTSSSVEDGSEYDHEEWRITGEQKEYYTNQFKNLQPNLEDVIKGPQAREFFLKSNLPMDILSRIWQLSDLDKDGALSLEEFCIAMHLVVLVKHGYELPAVLPATLLGQEPVELAANEEGGLSDEDVSKLINDDEKQDSGDWSAEFDSTDGAPRDVNERVQTYAQPSPTSVTVPSEARVHPVSSEGVDIPPAVTHATPPKVDHRSVVDGVTPAQFGTPQKDHHTVDENDPPSSPNPNLGGGLTQQQQKEAIASIARPRATANKNVNLMDASPWQLLPPPSGKMAAKSFPGAKRSLEMGSVESGIEESGIVDEKDNKLVAYNNQHQLPTTTRAAGDDDEFQRQRSPTADSSMDNVDEEDEDDNENRLKMKKKLDSGSYGGGSGYFRNFSKEKSRSIDSLRSDISESSMFEWKRQSIRRESRPRSFTGESTQSDVAASQFETPPVPPPRTNKGHQRASSLDFNQMFGNRSPRVSSEPKLQLATTPTDGSKTNPPQKPPRSNPPNHSASVRPRPNTTNDDYRRSRSLELKLDDPALDDKSLSNNRVKSLGSPLNENARTSSKEHVRFAEEPEVLSSSSKSPLEIQMRKHELQARLRDLKTKNSTLLSLISQLGMEWKETCEERISLEIRLQRAQQELE